MDDKNQQISEILAKNYLDDYIEILGMTVGIVNYYPQQADNQIRNAMTHLARAAAQDDQKQIDTELRQAFLHIERAKRDCLKLSVIGKKQQIIDQIKSVHLAKGGLPPEIMQRRLQAAFDQKVVYTNEARGKEIGPALEDLLEQLVSLETALIEFDKIALQPSRLVYVATRIIIYSKWLAGFAGTAAIIYVIKNVLVPMLGE